jgi:catechol 2,3-dioxygenase-like lactoylglutathione lyase family enzyme
MMKIRRIIETCIYSSDLGSMKKFYVDTLALPVVDEEEGKFIFLQAGMSMLLIFNPARTSESNEKLPTHGAETPPARIHFAMEIEAGDYERWKELLARNNTTLEKEVSWNEGKAKSLYFRDPSGNLVELITPGEWPVES